MISNNIEFDFDDILIIPSVTTNITSRYDDIVLPEILPLFTAPMDTVVNLKNMDNFMDNKINVTLPRTIKYDEFVARVRNENMQFYDKVFISLGFNDILEHVPTMFLRFHANAHILIDVANGHMRKIVEYAQLIKRFRPDIKIMVGNIANPETYLWYAENNCVDYIRVGIGNGGGCLTTKQSGVGHPMASLIHEVFQKKLLYVFDHKDDVDFKFPPAIVADGGMKDYSDVIKALALGADYVMLGSILNKALESAGNNYLYKIKLNNKLAGYFYDKGYPVKKYFRGMSTKEAQKAMGKTRIKTSEGIVRYRKVEYHLDGWIENFEHYLRNAMSYADAHTLNEFTGKANICQITKSAYDRFNK
jgi:IMP dehydrogenase/GMP reductase